MKRGLRVRDMRRPRALALLQAARKEGRRRGVVDAEGRWDLRRDAREGGEDDGRGWPRVCWPIYTSTDRSESLDRRWTVGISWAQMENRPRY